MKACRTRRIVAGCCLIARRWRNGPPTRGLAAQAGFLAPEAPALALRFANRARCCGRAASGATCRRRSCRMFSRASSPPCPARLPPVRQMLAQRLRAKDGVTMAPVGGGFALPHPSARITLGRDSGTVALHPSAAIALPPPELRVGWRAGDPAVFFHRPLAPRPSRSGAPAQPRCISRGPLREVLAKDGTDEEIFQVG